MSSSASVLKRQLLAVTRLFLRELGAQRAARAVSLDALLLDDLGLGSLERVAFLQRLEQHFGVRLAIEDLLRADSMRDMYHLLEQAEPHMEMQLPELALATAAMPVEVDPCETLVDVLSRYVEAEPKRRQACLLQSQGQVTELSYGSLWRKARHLAVLLQQHAACTPQAVIAIAVTEAEAFMVSYLAVVLAGLQPLVMRMPVNAHCLRPLYWRIRLPMLVSNQVAGLILQDVSAQNALRPLQQALASNLAYFIYDELIARPQLPEYELRPVSADYVIYRRLAWDHREQSRLQVTHAQWLQQIREDGAALNIKASDVVFSWLSLVEPMGLLSAWLGSLYYGLPFIWMPPQDFFAAPEKWLWGIHQYRASISFAPNAGYAKCVQEIKEQSCVGLDLSCWRVALNAGESMAAITVRQFCERFSAYGFSDCAMIQGYIPAGESMLLTLSMLSRPAHFERISRQVFFSHKRAQLLEADRPGGLLFVASGRSLPSSEIHIVDQDGRSLGDRQIGYIKYRRHFRLDSNQWCVCSDLGYIADETLYTVAADPQQVVKYGSYITPYALRMVITGIAALAKANYLSFSITEPAGGQAEWVLLLATDKIRNPFYVRRVQAVLHNHLTQCFGVAPDHMLFYAKHGLERFGETTDEQLQGAQAAYQAGELLPQPAWYHHRRLWGKTCALAKLCLRPLTKLAKLIYSIYFLLLFILLFIPCSFVVRVLPKRLSKKLFKFICRLIFLLAGCPIVVKGRAWLRQSEHVIFAPNHTSYLDVLALIAVLPSRVCFVGKRELKSIPLLGSLFKNMGHLFVDPADIRRGEENLQQLISVLQEGRSLVIYPEGTFTHANGLRPFKLGAFMAAAQTNTPVCPVICTGLRRVLRDRELLLRPGLIRVIAKPWQRPEADDMQAVLKLRDDVMAQIAEDCGEPVLELVVAGPPAAE